MGLERFRAYIKNQLVGKWIKYSWLLGNALCIFSQTHCQKNRNSVYYLTTTCTTRRIFKYNSIHRPGAIMQNTCTSWFDDHVLHILVRWSCTDKIIHIIYIICSLSENSQRALEAERKTKFNELFSCFVSNTNTFCVPMYLLFSSSNLHPALKGLVFQSKLFSWNF